MAELPVTRIETMAERLAVTIEGDRFNMLLLSSFAAAILARVAIGIYAFYPIRSRREPARSASDGLGSRHDRCMANPASRATEVDPIVAIRYE